MKLDLPMSCYDQVIGRWDEDFVRDSDFTFLGYIGIVFFIHSIMLDRLKAMIWTLKASKKHCEWRVIGRSGWSASVTINFLSKLWHLIFLASCDIVVSVVLDRWIFDLGHTCTPSIFIYEGDPLHQSWNSYWFRANKKENEFYLQDANKKEKKT